MFIVSAITDAQYVIMHCFDVLNRIVWLCLVYPSLHYAVAQFV